MGCRKVRGGMGHDTSLKYTVMFFSYEYSFLLFQNCFCDLINYLLTPQLFTLVLLISVASARVV